MVRSRNSLQVVTDDSLSPKLDTVTEISELKPETRDSKRRKVVQKTVVTVRIGHENGGKLKNEGPPSDLWSWRKYGQKPIKGSPHPRGYYRCSTSKGCSAKKQVERSRTDASMVIITYTSTHNHPCPDLTKQPKELPKTLKHAQTDEDLQPQEDQNQNQLTKSNNDEEEDRSEEQFHYLHSPINQEDPFTGNLEKTHDDTPSLLLLDEEPLCYQNLKTFSSTTKSEENDFFDELEELPISTSAFTGFMRSSNLFDERIPVVPS